MRGRSRTSEGDPDNGYGRLIAEAIAALRQGRLEAAELHLKKAMQDDFARPEVFNVLGVIMENRAEPDKAQNCYRAALALDPTYLPARKNLDRMVSFSGCRAWDLGEARA